MPLLRDPLAEWEGGAVTQILRPADDRLAAPVMGRSLRTDRWRYTKWNGGANRCPQGKRGVQSRPKSKKVAKGNPWQLTIKDSLPLFYLARMHQRDALRPIGPLADPFSENLHPNPPDLVGTRRHRFLMNRIHRQDGDK